MDVRHLSREEERAAHLFVLQELQKEYFSLVPAISLGVKKEVITNVVFPWYQAQQEEEMRQVEEAMKELDKYEFYASPV